MSYHGRIMNIRDGTDGAASIEYKRGHRDARHAAAEIALEADARIAEIEKHIWQDAYEKAKESGEFDDDAEIIANKAVEMTKEQK